MSNEEMLSKVFEQLADALAGDDREIESIEIRRATDEQWPCRVRFEGVEDFEGVFVTI